MINDKLRRKKRKDKDSLFLDGTKEKKRKKKTKKRRKMESSGSSSTSSSSDSSSEEDSDRSKSIRVAMRNKMRLQAQMILKEEMEGKLEMLGRIVEEDRLRKKEKEKEEYQQESNNEDNIINQWMTVNNNTGNDKHILEGLKGRLKLRQEVDKEKAIEAAVEQRRREREREEKELKEIREREQREMEKKDRENQEREKRDREERERIEKMERDRNRRKYDSGSVSPEKYRDRSRSRSVEFRRSHRQLRSQERQYRRSDKRHSPESDKHRLKRYEEEKSGYESRFEKQTSESIKNKKLINSKKLPFIGRMPLFKKKNDGEEKEIKKEDYDIRQTKFEPVSSARAFIPAPGVVHITKLATPPDPMHLIKINAENPPPPPKIIPEPPQISNEEDEDFAPPPPIITQISEDELMIKHHENIDSDNHIIHLPPGISEEKPPPKGMGNNLPRDFQEALNIIFPGDPRSEQMGMTQDPNLLMQYQYGMEYGMMYPGMQMYNYSVVQDTESKNCESLELMEKSTVYGPPTSAHDDLAMLGIDVEDMAAQTI